MKKTLNLLTILFAFTVFISCDGDDYSNSSNLCKKTIWYQDKDGDGKGNPDVTISACEQPEGYVSDNTDTDDNVIYSNVYDGDVDLKTTEEYNAFINDNYTDITGHLYIYSTKSLTSLSGLESLNSIGGGLTIHENESLTSLTGLDNITSIGAQLTITDNKSLTSLTGLNNLNSIKDNLVIRQNNLLTSLTGLDNLNSVGGNVHILNSTSLESLSGLNNLTSIGDNFYLFGNNLLESLNGLDNLTSIVNSLTISENGALINFCTITNLINSGGLAGNYDVSNNAYNPTIDDIKASRCSQ